MTLARTILVVVLLPIYLQAADCLGPQPPHVEPFQSVVLQTGRAFHYAYDELTPIATASEWSGEGLYIEFQASASGTLKVRRYDDLESRTLISEGEIAIQPAQAVDSIRSFVCGHADAIISDGDGVVVIEVLSGSLTIHDLYVMVAQDGMLSYSNYNPDLLDISNVPILIETRSENTHITASRSIIGRFYFLQESSDLSHWNTLSETSIKSTGKPLEWSLNRTLEKNTFYRVVEAK